MGMGIWSMHFIGMLAYSVEIPLRYGIIKTLFSLVIAMITSGFALAIASRPQLGLVRLAVGSIVMGAGICGMHYSGMSAIQIVPMISYQPMLVLASIAIAIGASFAALWLAFKLRSGQSTYIALARGGAAAIMGLAISGMHYTGMAASRLAVGAICYGGASFDNNWLAGTIGLVALGILGLTLITAVYDSHLLSQTRSGSSGSTPRYNTARTCWRSPRARPASPPGSSTSLPAERCGRKTRSNRCARPVWTTGCSRMP
jgi:NO-binding membrane sensor protein with MHYT domain